jgi:TatD DNase family protein
VFADAHAHLSMPAFDEDLSDVIARARQAGVTRIMTCATSMADAEKNLQVARQHGLKAAAGFHPHQAKEWTADSEAALRRLIAASPEIAAIGEIGLDFHYSFSPPGTQSDVLRTQIALARSLRLPIVVHCRNAKAELGRILVEEKAFEVGGMLHCFSEDADFARFCLDQGLHVSFSGIITFKNAAPIREAARVVPLDRLLVESDAPYLAPVPLRGHRNEPAFVAETIRAVAAIKQVALEEIAAAATANFDRLFADRPTV